MKILKKIMVTTVLGSALLFSACCIPNQPYTRAEFEKARQEAMEEEARSVALQREKSQLEAELNAKLAKLAVLREMEAEMQ